ncbi:MAG: efflux RND transporter periplasmic adaptor subunit [Acidobacteria bacterium]|nr:efflux RND transporter periplasmic adaptor subunit [Acidobacteriota bacterium]
MKKKNRNIAVLAFAVGALLLSTALLRSQPGENNRPQKPAESAPPAGSAVQLSPSQVNSLKIAAAGTHVFALNADTIGTISFADERSVQVFPPYQGKIVRSLAELNENVRKGQPLYTIDSPDLIQAESTLISAAGVLELTTKELARARTLRSSNGVSERELEQAASDQQTAEGSLRAARNAVRVFGKTEDEIDRIIASRKVDAELIVRSPISGQVTSFAGPAGLFVQPGTGTSPYTVSDLSVKWMLASVPEPDMPLFRQGQPVAVKVIAYPERVFHGVISKIYSSVDPVTHRGTVRSEIADPRNELRPGMLADFSIRVGKPVESLALPANAVVREGDGTMTAWVTTDRRQFSQRSIRVGQRSDGWVQVLAGLTRGELVVTDGAIFLSNMLQGAPAD